MLAETQQLVAIATSLVQVDDWDDVSDGDVLEALRALESAARLVSAASIAVTAQADRRGLSAARAYSSVGALLRRSLGIAPGEAKLRERLASSLCGTAQPSGAITPPRLPATADALGAISLAHAQIIHRTITDLPGHLEPSVLSDAESFLADQARVLDPVELRRVAKRLQATLDQDGLLRDERDAVADRELCISRDHRGRYVFLGRLDAEAGAAFQSAIHSLAAPEPAADGQPDPRTAARRHADALVALVDRALAAGDLPTDGGERPQLTVTIGLDALSTAVGSATIGHDDVLSASSARRIACDARIIPMVLGSRSEPLDVGRASYVVPQAMRRALVVRDEGCAFPGCGQLPGWTHAHHIQHWADGGDTALENLVLLCGHHHRVIHHDDWEVRITAGQPEFFPPAWIDPDRNPRRRTRIPDQAVSRRQHLGTNHPAYHGWRPTVPTQQPGDADPTQGTDHPAHHAWRPTVPTQQTRAVDPTQGTDHRVHRAWRPSLPTQQAGDLDPTQSTNHPVHGLQTSIPTQQTGDVDPTPTRRTDHPDHRGRTNLSTLDTGEMDPTPSHSDRLSRPSCPRLGHRTESPVR